MPMAPEAKSALSSTIRGLRTRLLDDLHAATEGRSAVAGSTIGPKTRISRSDDERRR